MRAAWRAALLPVAGGAAVAAGWVDPPASPVFVQQFGEDEWPASQTLPANRCVRCRGDRRSECRSAKVVCPAKAGDRPVERLWRGSRDCEGEPDRVRALSAAAEVQCPGPGHHSPRLIDLARFVPKLLREREGLFPSKATADAAVEEYRRMLLLIQLDPSRPAVPSKRVDAVWHEHILDTTRYQRDCLRLFGRYLHHAPSFGGDNETATRAEKRELAEQQRHMLGRYRAAFGVEAPRDTWPAAKLPDCCAAVCVKPTCKDCVGCDFFDCGYQGADLLGNGGSPAATHLSPAQYGGYVPAALEHTQPLPPPAAALPAAQFPPQRRVRVPSGYQHAVVPIPGVRFAWTIDGDQGYFYMERNTTGWYAFGISQEEPYGMGHADYNLVMHTDNYTGVFDLYRYQTDEGYPCWDVLYMCSVHNDTKGAGDTRNNTISRSGAGVTVAQWSRKLDTNDSKDWPIAPGDTHSIFAVGSQDSFYYHSARVQCVIDFFTGQSDCGAPAPTPSPPGPAPTAMKCDVCQHVYDPMKDCGGMANKSMDCGPDGVAFKDLPDTWTCPICNAAKDAYKPAVLPSGEAAWVHTHTDGEHGPAVAVGRAAAARHPHPDDGLVSITVCNDADCGTTNGDILARQGECDDFREVVGAPSQGTPYCHAKDGTLTLKVCDSTDVQCQGDCKETVLNIGDPQLNPWPTGKYIRVHCSS